MRGSRWCTRRALPSPTSGACSGYIRVLLSGDILESKAQRFSDRCKVRSIVYRRAHAIEEPIHHLKRCSNPGSSLGCGFAERADERGSGEIEVGI